MTPFQQTAMRYPCYFAVQTAHPRYRHQLNSASLVLSVNSGYE